MNDDIFPLSSIFFEFYVAGPTHCASTDTTGRPSRPYCGCQRLRVGRRAGAGGPTFDAFCRQLVKCSKEEVSVINYVSLNPLFVVTSLPGAAKDGAQSQGE